MRAKLENKVSTKGGEKSKDIQEAQINVQNTLY